MLLIDTKGHIPIALDINILDNKFNVDILFPHRMKNHPCHIRPIWQ